MTTKEMVRTVMDALPDEASLDEVIHALYLRAAFQRGLREVREGKGIPHEQAKARLKKWVK
ncbi:MAG: hypothetical protein PHU85_19360 [Phycisphaerae bacterium]|nr:hypothetical protein [Phycisphaerae bacterium]